jgi:hypothetical protein
MENIQMIWAHRVYLFSVFIYLEQVRAQILDQNVADPGHLSKKCNKTKVFRESLRFS